MLAYLGENAFVMSRIWGFVAGFVCSNLCVGFPQINLYFVAISGGLKLPEKEYNKKIKK